MQRFNQLGAIEVIEHSHWQNHSVQNGDEIDELFYFWCHRVGDVSVGIEDDNQRIQRHENRLENDGQCHREILLHGVV